MQVKNGLEVSKAMKIVIFLVTQINQLDWEKRAMENESIEFIKSLIALTKEVSMCFG